MRLAWALALMTMLAGAARADDNAQDRARAHYDIGRGLYRLGDYAGALKEFTAGYELAHRPGFLLNIGQTYRKLGDLVHARELYRQFLDEAQAGDPDRAQAAQVLAELDAAVRNSPAGATAHAPAAASTARAPRSEATSPPLGATARSDAPASPAPSIVVDGRVAARDAHPRRRALRIAGITVGLAGVGLLGGGLGAALSADDTARALNRLDQSGALFDPNQDSAYGRDRAIEGACFGVGGALAAAGIVLIAVSVR